MAEPPPAQEVKREESLGLTASELEETAAEQEYEPEDIANATPANSTASHTKTRKSAFARFTETDDLGKCARADSAHAEKTDQDTNSPGAECPHTEGEVAEGAGLGADGIATERAEPPVLGPAPGGDPLTDGGGSIAAAKPKTDKPKKDKAKRDPLRELRGSPQLPELRRMVHKDPKALQHFLKAMTEANPKLMKKITRHQDEFMQMLLDEPENSAPTVSDSPASVLGEVEHDKQKHTKPSRDLTDPKELARKRQREQQRLEKAFQPTTSAIHPLANLHNPYSCAVCKVTKDLMVCGTCKCARFCGRDHQRQFWPRHESVCKFIAATQGGLLAEVSGLRWEDAFQKILEVWTRANQEPRMFEYEQLIHLPRCHKCRKVPAIIPCEMSHAVGYCSEACQKADNEWRESWQCAQAMMSNSIAVLMHKGGGGLPYEVGKTDRIIEPVVYENGWNDFMEFVEISANGMDFDALPPVAQHVLIDQLSYPLSVMEALFRIGKPIDELCAGKEHMEVHILGPDYGALADPEKYSEWLYRGGPQLRSLDVVPHRQADR